MLWQHLLLLLAATWPKRTFLAAAARRVLDTQPDMPPPPPLSVCVYVRKRCTNLSCVNWTHFRKLAIAYSKLAALTFSRTLTLQNELHPHEAQYESLSREQLSFLEQSLEKDRDRKKGSEGAITMSIGQEMEISLLKISNMLNMMVLHNVCRQTIYYIWYIPIECYVRFDCIDSFIWISGSCALKATSYLLWDR